MVGATGKMAFIFILPILLHFPCKPCENWFIRQLCVHRDMKHLGGLATPRPTLTHLSCSPNFSRVSYLDERTLTYEPIVKLKARDSF